MKKTLLFGLMLCEYFFAQAQVTMENHVPPFGTAYSMYTISSAVADPAIGADQTWDYSAITSSASLSFTVMDPASLPSQIKDSVPGTTYAVRIEAGGPIEKRPYDFIVDRTTHYVKAATKSSGNTPPQKGNDTIIMFNHSYGTVISYRGMNVLYAGYGTLKIKSKTYEHVVLLKSYKEGTSDTVLQFHQFVPHYQLLMSLAKMSGVIQNKLHWELDASNPTGLPEEASLNAFVYPNPATNFVGIRLENPAQETNIMVLDLQGRKVMEQLFHGDRDLMLNLEGLLPGAYMINIRSGELSANRKLIVQ